MYRILRELYLQILIICLLLSLGIIRYSPVGAVMKISIIVLLCLMTLMVGCSQSHNPVSSLWKERQMDDNQRIYGNPYESRGQSQGVWLPTPY
jgi:hypothetical protein